MNLIIDPIKNYLPDFNKKIYDTTDAIEFCRKHKILTVETDLIDDLGEYRIHRGVPTILIHPLVKPEEKSWVFNHEIAHFCLHPTTMAKFSDEVTKRKIEMEANCVAAIMLMPKFIIENKTLAEIQDEFGYPLKIILIRKWIADEQKI